jgi:16S rRNA processing protein RimM
VTPEETRGAAEDWVAIALLGKPRGNRGELTALSLSSRPERFESLREVSLFGGRVVPAMVGQRVSVETTWFHQGVLIFKFRGVDTISQAERLTGAEVCIPRGERISLDPGEFFESDLVGSEVVERSGESLGRVRSLDDAGGSGVLTLEDGFMIPFVRSICVEIDPRARRIVVELPEGLKELYRP